MKQFLLAFRLWVWVNYSLPFFVGIGSYLIVSFFEIRCFPISKTHHPAGCPEKNITALPCYNKESFGSMGNLRDSMSKLWYWEMVNINWHQCLFFLFTSRPNNWALNETMAADRSRSFVRLKAVFFFSCIFLWRD